jgi:hypothetical protein
VNSTLIREITGEDLYQLWIPPERVLEMHRAFRDSDSETTARETEALGGHHPAEIDELRKLFRICADYGLGLVGCW